MKLDGLINIEVKELIRLKVEGAFKCPTCGKNVVVNVLDWMDGKHPMALEGELSSKIGATEIRCPNCWASYRVIVSENEIVSLIMGGNVDLIAKVEKVSDESKVKQDIDRGQVFMFGDVVKEGCLSKYGDGVKSDLDRMCVAN